MSEFVSKLEGYADLEVSIIRVTKINKVLKAILKMTSIPKEEEFNFKARSQSLLDKWNKLLASEPTEPSEPSATAATTNGTATDAKAESEDAKPSPVEAANGTKESSAEEKTEEKVEEKTEEKPSEEEAGAPPASELKDAPAEPEDVPAPSTEEPTKESIAEPTPVEASA